MATKTTSKTATKSVKKTESVPATKPAQATSSKTSAGSASNRNIVLIITSTFFIIVLLLLARGFAVVASVNGEAISRIVVVKQLEKQAGAKAVENLITKKLILQEMKKNTIVITQGEIENEIKKITTNLVSQGTTLDQALAAQGMTKDQLNEEIKIQLFIQKVNANKSKVTEKEVADFVTTNKAQFPEGTTDEQMKAQAMQQLTAQKQQQETASYIKSLQDRAKIIRFVQY
jgi:hypothetical protein